MKKNGPWTVKSTEVKYKNPWIEVCEDQVVRPDGKDGIYGTTSFGEAGSQILPLDAEGNVYLIKEFAYARGVVDITVVAGGLGKEETPLDGAKRELLEETGIQAERWTYLNYANPLTSYTKLANHMFLAENLTFTKSAAEPTESIQVYKLPFGEAVSMVMNGSITAENACLLILKAKRFIEV